LRTLSGHSHFVFACAFSHDDRVIVSASADYTLKLWDARSGECLSTLRTDGPMFGCGWSHGGDRIVAAGARGVYFLMLGR
jgi:WD40 repeat protein